jgi:poly(3-hydroxybutyrate) depolymerase
MVKLLKRACWGCSKSGGFPLELLIFAAALAFSAVIDRAQPVAPRISTEPADQALASGARASFSVSSSGTLPLYYQWRQNDVDMLGATNRTLILRNVQLPNAGIYTVTVSNLVGSVPSRPAQLSVGEGKIYTNSFGARLPYRLFPPADYDPAKKYPLVVFWNGSAAAGTDNLSQLLDWGQFVFLSAENRARNPCFFLCPQFPSSDPNCEDNLKIIDQGAELIDGLKAQLSIDPDRVYMTGLSFGGYYTWIFSARYPNLVAATVPMSGGWLCHTNFLNIRVPVWNFHAADDGTVSVSNSDSAVKALRNAGGNPIYTRFPSGGHTIWRKAYNTPGLVDWLMAQRRGAGSPISPLLTISLPSSPESYLTHRAVIDFSGTASYSSNVLQVAWTNTTTRAGGLASGTNDWSLKGIPLRIGATNSIVIIGTGTSYTPDLSSRGDTTFSETRRVVQTPLQLTNLLVSPDGEGITLTWSAQEGKRYKMQAKTDLDAPDWLDVIAIPVLQGSTASITDYSLTAEPRRFYRLVELQ